MTVKLIEELYHMFGMLNQLKIKAIQIKFYNIPYPTIVNFGWYFAMNQAVGNKRFVLRHALRLLARYG